jgi:hypothetical protein
VILFGVLVRIAQGTIELANLILTLTLELKAYPFKVKITPPTPPEIGLRLVIYF